MRKAIGKGILVFLLLSCIASIAYAQATPSVAVHGYMQNRMYVNPNGIARFAVERVSLSAVATLPEDRTGYLEVYFQPWAPDAVGASPTTGANVALGEQGRTYLESAYLDSPFANGRIRIGKGRGLNFGLTPAIPNRKTSQYNILAETFTQDRIQGFQYSWKNGTADFGASLYTDLRLENRQIGATPGLNGNNIVKHVAERDDTPNLSGRTAVCARYGWSGPCFKLHLSGMEGQFIQADATTIATAYGTTTTNTTHKKYGVDAQFAKGTLVGSGEYYVGKFSFETVSGYSVMVGYEPVDKNARRLYARYSAINNDQTPTATQITWPVQQLLIGINQPIGKGVWAELNYEKNTETPGGGAADVDNDLLFLEFFTGF